MKKVDALYSFLINEIKRICETTDEAYWTSLSEPMRDRFDALCDSLSDHKIDLETCHHALTVSARLRDLKVVFDEFQLEFSGYPEFDFSKITYSLAMAIKLCESVGLVADEDVNSDFGFSPCSLNFSCRAFASSVTPTNSNIIWFNPCDIASLQSLVSYDTDVELWYCLAAFLEDIDFTQPSEILVSNSASLSEKSNVVSLLKIYMLADGKKIARTIEYIRSPRNSSINDFDPERNYAQFSDVVQIMGEYVDRKDVLSKYLSIYHVVENFMFKSPIVKLERARGGVMFSIRDFRALYNEVEKKEVEAIIDLMKGAFLLPFSASTIGHEIYRAWTDFLTVHAANEQDIDAFLAKLGMRKSSVSDLNSFRNFFAKTLYRIRCSVVHNKETEFHISSETYCEGCRLVMEEFYLPSLEELIFLLICKDNSVVWYHSDSIALWNRVL